MTGPLRRTTPRLRIERACIGVGVCDRLRLGDTGRRLELVRKLTEALARPLSDGDPLPAEAGAFVADACRGWESSAGVAWLQRHPEGWGAMERLAKLGAVPQALSELLSDYKRAATGTRPRPTLARRKTRANEASSFIDASRALDRAASACEEVNRAEHYVPAGLIFKMWKLAGILEDVADLRVTEDWPLVHETVAIQRHIAASTSGYRDEQVSRLLNAVHSEVGHRRMRRSPESLERFRLQHPFLYEQPGQFELSVLLAGDRCASLAAPLDGRLDRRPRAGSKPGRRR